MVMWGRAGTFSPPCSYSRCGWCGVTTSALLHHLSPAEWSVSVGSTRMVQWEGAVKVLKQADCCVSRENGGISVHVTGLGWVQEWRLSSVVMSRGRGVMWTAPRPENPRPVSQPLAFPPALALGMGRPCSRETSAVPDKYRLSRDTCLSVFRHHIRRWREFQ